MDLRTKIQNKVFNGLKKFGTVNVPCDYLQMASPTYDPNLGQATNTILSTTTIPVIFDEFNPTRTSSTDVMNDEIPVRGIDKIAIFSSLLLSFTPSIHDVIVDTTTTTEWRVMGVTGDPAGAHWELHIRPVNPL